MAIHFAIRRRLSVRWLGMSAALLSVLSGNAAHACMVLTSQDCKTAADSLPCRLMALLNLLYVAAGVLVVVLIVVIIVAVRAYRKNSKDDAGEV